ncbi:2OG-Fe(II) oxygenase [Pelagibius sp. Alg239-R121]|uniref:2OG-Fe(II) oxygenase n=1 Tax=Pelagibius sp. Alg239-R121 TaxID=2993448 RepID=UPI0024A70E39|nr:2OG-Fe(II) oxygenase [Pelagibius sp. Alg239-R121]
MSSQDLPPRAPDFVEIYNDVIDGATCRNIIERFENDDRKQPSWSQKSKAPKDRTGMMLCLPDHDDWQDVVDQVGRAVMLRVHDYAKRYPAFGMVLNSGQCKLTHPLLERIEPGQGFDWHIDGNKPGTENRVLSTILYLATIDQGGETQFAYQGKAVRPAAGMLVIFPPFWTHLHRGATPAEGQKYNLTSFVILPA